MAAVIYFLIITLLLPTNCEEHVLVSKILSIGIQDTGTTQINLIENPLNEAGIMIYNNPNNNTPLIQGYTFNTFTIIRNS
jgi:hypothetical protein